MHIYHYNECSVPFHYCVAMTGIVASSPRSQTRPLQCGRSIAEGRREFQRVGRRGQDIDAPCRCYSHSYVLCVTCDVYASVCDGRVSCDLCISPMNMLARAYTRWEYRPPPRGVPHCGKDIDAFCGCHCLTHKRVRSWACFRLLFLLVVHFSFLTSVPVCTTL